MPRIGLIAGNRRFPIIVANEARKRGYSVIAVGIKGETKRALGSLVRKIYWLNLNELSRLLEVFQSERVKEVVFAGQVSPRQLFRPNLRNSREIRDLLDSLEDKRANTIFGAIAKRLEEAGMHVLDSTFLLGDFMPKEGVLTHNQPRFSDWEDIYLGMNVAKDIAYLDIGQTVAIKDKAIVAVEALEGTDNLIRRAGRIARKGVIIIKVSKPAQDMRFDVPVVGLGTIAHLVQSHAAGLAIEAGKTLFIDKEPAIKLADKRDLFIVAV